jgi:hypothetical protein
MDGRAKDFINMWLSENVPDPGSINDPEAASEGLSARLIEAARVEGLTGDDLSEEVGKLQNYILDILQSAGHKQRP